MSVADRIRFAYTVDAASRRVLALVLLSQMLRSVPTAGQQLTWSALGSLLGSISIELTNGGDEARGTWFRSLAEQCFRLKQEMRRRTQARRPAGGITHARKAPRFWQPVRVVEATACEVRS